ncbi:MAG: SGNH/GDSL hydrolase family protein [Pseudomonadota bacterium]
MGGDMLGHRKTLAWALLVLGAMGIRSAMALPTFSALWGFGDSLTDNGNAALTIDSGALVPIRNPGDREVLPIPNPGYVPSNPYPGSEPFDRATNGRIWLEHVAERFSLPLIPAAGGGTNFAFSGANLSPGLAPVPPSLRAQVDSFLAAAPAVPPNLIDDGLFVLWGGGNDARGTFADRALPAVLLGRDPTAAIVEDVNRYLTTLESLIRDLAGVGASHFFVPNVPAFEFTPAIAATDALLAAGGAPAGLAFGLASDVSDAYNGNILALLGQLEQGLGVDIIPFDVAAVIERTVINPAAFGLSEPAQPCAFPVVCANPDAVLFWDGIHPASGGHRALGEQAIAALIPSPATLGLMALGLISLGWCRRRVPAR